MKKLSNSEAELKKRVGYKKKRVKEKSLWKPYEPTNLSVSVFFAFFFSYFIRVRFFICSLPYGN